MTSAPPLNVFISYSHKDEELKEELEVHLANLIRQKKINPWQDRALEAGTEWDAEIKAQLEAAHIILLLVTPRFMASGYINDIELQHAMERHHEGTARVIPIILKSTDWTGTEFSKLQVLPKDAKPVTTWKDQDEAFLNVAQGIRRTVESLSASLSASGRIVSPSSTPKSTLSTSPQSAPPQSASLPVSPIQKRLALNRLLMGLPGPQLSAVVTVVRPPAGIVPPASAPQGDRVSALMDWAEGAPDWGLDTLETVVNQVINP